MGSLHPDGQGGGDEAVTLNIIGCCLSREAVNQEVGPAYKVEAYIQNIHPYLIFQRCPDGYQIDDSVIGVWSPSFEHNFNRRMMRLLMNGGADDQLLARKGEWLIIDTHYSYVNGGAAEESVIRRGSRVLLNPRCYDDPVLMSATFPGEDERRYYQSHFSKYIFEIRRNSEKYRDVKIEPLKACLNVGFYEKAFADFVKRNWGKKVIVIDSRSSIYKYQGGAVVPTKEFSCYYEAYSGRLIQSLVENLDCYYIDNPLTCIASDSDSEVHYLAEIRRYLKESIDNVILNHRSPSQMRREQYRITSRYMVQVGSIILGDVLPVKETAGAIQAYLSLPRGHPDLVPLCDRLISQEEWEALGWKARAYRDGKGVSKDLDKAASLYEEAANKGVTWARYELFSVLWGMEGPENDARMAAFAERMSDAGDMEMRARLSKCYRHGRGVPKDMGKAARLALDAFDHGVAWAGNDYVNTLWSMHDLGVDKTMAAFAKSLAEEGQRAMQAYLGRMYRDGRGVEADMRKAAEWMGKASDQGLEWINVEYMDVLWRLKDPESDVKIFSMAKGLAESGNWRGMGRLARCYRDGRGIEADVQKALAWMMKASDFNDLWMNECADLIIDRKCLEQYGWCMSRLTSISDNVASTPLRIGRMYRDGLGVPQDLKASAEWMRKSAGKGVLLAKFELFDVLWRIGGADSDREMFTIASELAEKGEKRGMGRLARCYRDGRGVDADMDKARFWMKKAADGGLAWAAKELSEMRSRKRQLVTLEKSFPDSSI